MDSHQSAMCFLRCRHLYQEMPAKGLRCSERIAIAGGRSLSQGERKWPHLRCVSGPRLPLRAAEAEHGAIVAENSRRTCFTIRGRQPAKPSRSFEWGADCRSGRR